MFIADDIETKKTITRLSPEWHTDFEGVRKRALDGLFVCPLCKHELSFRRPHDHYRSHFAHKPNSNCPFSRLPEEVFAALTQLHSWLETKHPGEVHCAKDLQIDGWSRPADVTVQLADGRISAYWVFDRPPKNWRVLREGTPANVSRHVLYTLSARNLVQEDTRLKLAAGQRGFIGKSTFNAYEGKGHLYFLDSEQHNVVLYRGLSCDHDPDLYSWNHMHKIPWSRCRFFERTGEIVADGEHEHGLSLG